MSLSSATYVVQRNGTQYGVIGSELGRKILPGDKMIVQRDGVVSCWTVSISGSSLIRDDDIFVCTDDDGITKQVPGSRMKVILP